MATDERKKQPKKDRTVKHPFACRCDKCLPPYGVLFSSESDYLG